MPDSDAGYPAFVAAHEDRLVRSLMSETTLDSLAAGDVVEDVLPVAFERRFATDGAAFGWLRVAARHHAAGSPAWSDAADAALLQAHAAAAALARLSRADRDILKLRFVDGLLPAAVAERLGLPLPEVLARLDRAVAAAAPTLPAHDRPSFPIPLPRVAAAVVLVVAGVLAGFTRGGAPVAPPSAAAPVPSFAGAVPVGNTPAGEVPARSGADAAVVRTRATGATPVVVVPIRPPADSEEPSEACRTCSPRRLDELHVKLPTEVGDVVGQREVVVQQTVANEHVALCATFPAVPAGPASCHRAGS